MCIFPGATLASFCHLGFISDPLIVSKFHNETNDPKRQENKIYTIVKGRKTFYRRHTVPVTSCSEVKYVLKRVSFGSKDCTKELKLECTDFLGQTLKRASPLCKRFAQIRKGMGRQCGIEQENFRLAESN